MIDTRTVLVQYQYRSSSNTSTVYSYNVLYTPYISRYLNFRVIRGYPVNREINFR